MKMPTLAMWLSRSPDTKKAETPALENRTCGCTEDNLSYIPTISLVDPA
jgi:hypothetical protein